MTWADALDRYGTDKPDLRFGMELVDLSAVFEGTEVKAFSSPATKAIVVKDGAAYTRSRLDELTEQAKKLGAAGLAWFRVVESGGAGPGPGLEGPLARHLSEAEAVRLLEVTKAEPGDLVLIVSDEYRRACEVMGTLRTAIGGPPVGQGPHRYVWVVDFPMFESIGADGNPQPAHHPFTMPYAEDLPLLETDPLAVRSQAYDLVLNGWELGSGSVRIYQRAVQERVFAALGIEAGEAERRFGFLLGAFRYGAPPHAGFAFGVDRLAAILAGEENIREVIAYPKTQSGADPLTGAPAPLPAAALVELGIRVVVPPGASGGAEAAGAPSGESNPSPS
jgi:aspartyl-tRNA synthetase